MNRQLAFVADEGVEKAVVPALRKQYNVLYIAAQMVSAQDDEVLQEARRLERILITLDKAFGELVFRDGRAHAGVILCRIQSLPLDEAAQLVLQTIDKYGQDLWQAFTVIQPQNIRIRRL